MALYLDCNPRRQHRTNRGCAYSIDTLISRSPNTCQLKSEGSKEIHDEFFKALRGKTVKAIEEDIPPGRVLASFIFDRVFALGDRLTILSTSSLDCSV